MSSTKNVQNEELLDATAERIKAEIIAQLSKYNPNIGRTQSVVLKNGSETFKIATIYQILDAESRKHHHAALSIQSWDFRKKTGKIEEKGKYNINTVSSFRVGLSSPTLPELTSQAVKSI